MMNAVAGGAHHMDSLRNLPIILQYEDDGTIVAQCPLLPNCSCRATSRALALETMQRLIKDALATAAEAQKAERYEVVYLAVAPSSDSENDFDDRFSRRAPVEGPRLELR